MTDEEIVRLRGQTEAEACPCAEPLDFPTAFYQARGDKILRLLPRTRADQVAMGAGTVETRIINIERRVGSGEGFHIGDHVDPEGGLAAGADGKLAIAENVRADIEAGVQAALTSTLALREARNAAGRAEAALEETEAAKNAASFACSQASIAADRAASAEDAAANALALANGADAKADDASEVASAASEKANAATATANAANETAQAANETAASAGKVAADAGAKASAASGTAGSAWNIATSAAATARDATDTANAASDTAQNAQNAAIAARSLADAASNLADEAKAIAGQSQATANAASEVASAASEKATAASATAGNALSTANAARALCVDMKGASATAAGAHGFVPSPAAGAANRFLRSDGVWSVPPDTDTTYAPATQTASGLMSPDDKKKLDGVAAGATATAAPPAAATAAPRAHGTAAVGTSAKYAREDHVHPSNNTDTHWTSHLYAGSGAAANAATTNGNTKLTICDNSTVRDTVAIKGAGAASVTSDAAGNITITGTNTTYAPATQSANGLMSAADKKKVDNLNSASYVARAGDTMTGNLNIAAAQPTFSLINSGIDLGDNIYNSTPAAFALADRDNRDYGRVSSTWWSGIYPGIHIGSVHPVTGAVCGIQMYWETAAGKSFAILDFEPETGSDWQDIPSTHWVRNLLASTASVASLSTAAELPQSRRVSVSPAQAAAMAANEAAGISALSDENLADFELCDTFLAPAEADINATGTPLYIEAPLTEDELFSRLRSERNRRLLVVDAQIAILNRKLRRAGNLTDKNKINNQISAWDEYALALCDLPDQEGAPWDGGGRETPWPEPPGVNDGGAGAGENGEKE